MFLLFTLLFACDPTCEQVCERIVVCQSELGDWEGMPSEICTENCLRQEVLYEDVWDDQALDEALGSTKSCLMEKTCEEIDEGVCYDPELYAW